MPCLQPLQLCRWACTAWLVVAVVAAEHLTCTPHAPFVPQVKSHLILSLTSLDALNLKVLTQTSVTVQQVGAPQHPSSQPGMQPGNSAACIMYIVASVIFSVHVAVCSNPCSQALAVS